MQREMKTDIGTITKERGRASQWSSPPLAHNTKGIVHKWWLEVNRLVQLDPGLNRYLHTPMGKDQ